MESKNSMASQTTHPSYTQTQLPSVKNKSASRQQASVPATPADSVAVIAQLLNAAKPKVNSSTTQAQQQQHHQNQQQQQQQQLNNKLQQPHSSVSPSAFAADLPPDLKRDFDQHMAFLIEACSNDTQALGTGRKRQKKTRGESNINQSGTYSIPPQFAHLKQGPYGFVKVPGSKETTTLQPYPTQFHHPQPIYKAPDDSQQAYFPQYSSVFQPAGVPMGFAPVLFQPFQGTPPMNPIPQEALSRQASYPSLPLPLLHQTAFQPVSVAHWPQPLFSPSIAVVPAAAESDRVFTTPAKPLAPMVTSPSPVSVPLSAPRKPQMQPSSPDLQARQASLEKQTHGERMDQDRASETSHCENDSGQSRQQTPSGSEIEEDSSEFDIKSKGSSRNSSLRSSDSSMSSSLGHETLSQVQDAVEQIPEEVLRELAEPLRRYRQQSQTSQGDNNASTTKKLLAEHMEMQNDGSLSYHLDLLRLSSLAAAVNQVAQGF